jgi:hypothetical protein
MKAPMVFHAVQQSMRVERFASKSFEACAQGQVVVLNALSEALLQSSR